MEDVPFDSESAQPRAGGAVSLRTIADRLDADGAVTLPAGYQPQTRSVPARSVFEATVERETSTSGPADRSLEREWDDGANDTDSPLEVS